MDRELKEALKSRYARLTEKLPARVTGYLDWHLLPGHRHPVGLPFNRQLGRAEIFRQILRRMDFRAVVETGTYRATTTVFLARTSGLPVYTVEADPRIFYYARQRCKTANGIHCELGDSIAFVEKLARAPELSGSVFFYLDAHGQEYLPLYEELQIIARSWSDPVIMIDDFQVPDDPAYGFDDYGPGKCLTLSYLPAELRHDFRLFWPSVRGEDESGSRRGCVVLGRKGASRTERLAGLPVLREILPLGREQNQGSPPSGSA